MALMLLVNGDGDGDGDGESAEGDGDGDGDGAELVIDARTCICFHFYTSCFGNRIYKHLIAETKCCLAVKPLHHA